MELVKNRAYEAMGEAPAASAKRALREALSTIQRLFAPFIPFATEEAWRWWNDTSIHAAAWPSPSGLCGHADLVDAAIDALALVRRAKSEAKVSQRAPVESATISIPAACRVALEAGVYRSGAAGTITAIEIVDAPGDQMTCVVVLAPLAD